MSFHCWAGKQTVIELTPSNYCASLPARILAPHANNQFSSSGPEGEQALRAHGSTFITFIKQAEREATLLLKLLCSRIYGSIRQKASSSRLLSLAVLQGEDKKTYITLEM